jgi:hypothetical protein
MYLMTRSPAGDLAAQLGACAGSASVWLPGPIRPLDLLETVTL